MTPEIGSMWLNPDTQAAFRIDGPCIEGYYNITWIWLKNDTAGLIGHQFDCHKETLESNFVPLPDEMKAEIL
jgi:hypothetical protein